MVSVSREYITSAATDTARSAWICLPSGAGDGISGTQGNHSRQSLRVCVNIRGCLFCCSTLAFRRNVLVDEEWKKVKVYDFGHIEGAYSDAS